MSVLILTSSDPSLLRTPAAMHNVQVKISKTDADTIRE